MEGSGTPVCRAPGTAPPSQPRLAGALRHDLAAHLAGVELVLDDQVDDLLSPLVDKLLALVSDGAWEVAAEELNHPLHLVNSAGVGRGRAEIIYVSVMSVRVTVSGFTITTSITMVCRISQSSTVYPCLFMSYHPVHHFSVST